MVEVTPAAGLLVVNDAPPPLYVVCARAVAGNRVTRATAKRLNFGQENLIGKRGAAADDMDGDLALWNCGT
jgi:hypothetical protein